MVLAKFHGMARTGVKMQSFELECGEVRNFADFVVEVNRKFLERLDASVPWNGNLDAFSDFLSWPGEKYQITIHGADVLKKVLSETKPGDELTLYDHIIDIFLDNKDLVRLRLK